MAEKDIFPYFQSHTTTLKEQEENSFTPNQIVHQHALLGFSEHLIQNTLSANDISSFQSAHALLERSHHQLDATLLSNPVSREPNIKGVHFSLRSDPKLCDRLKAAASSRLSEIVEFDDQEFNSRDITRPESRKSLTSSSTPLHSPYHPTPHTTPHTTQQNKHEQEEPVIQDLGMAISRSVFHKGGRKEQPKHTPAPRRYPPPEQFIPDDEEVVEVKGDFSSAKEVLLKNQSKSRIGGSSTSTSTSSSDQGSTTNVRRGRNLGGKRRGFNPPYKKNDEEEETENPVPEKRRRMTNPSASGNNSSKSSATTKSKPQEEERNPILDDERLQGLDPEIVERILVEILEQRVNITWDDIAGLEFAKDTVKEIVIAPMLRPDIFTGLRAPPRGLLLFGPPGTGKTMIGRVIASQSRSTFFSISASSLTSKWIGEGEKLVRALFAVARVQQPSVIFVDEIDSLLSSRAEGEADASRRLKTEFLVQMDGAGTDSEDRILLIGATNRPQELDDAMRRRLVKRLYIPLPDPKARGQLIKHLLSDQSHSLNDEELSKIVELTKGYSGFDLNALCKESAIGPLRSVGNIETVDLAALPPISFQHFSEALHQVRPSVSDKDLAAYAQWNKTFGSFPNHTEEKEGNDC